jgi:hypothetical protein
VVAAITTLTVGGVSVLAVTVDMGGGAVGPVRVLDPYIPVVGHTVEMLDIDGDRIVLGKLAAASPAVPQILTRNGGFPLAGSVTTEEDVLDRYTVAAVPWARRIACQGMTFAANTQSTDHEILWYRDSTVIGRSQVRGVAGIGNQMVCIGQPFLLAANTGVVLELRLARVNGTGIVSTSASDYTTSSVITVPS